MVTRPEWEFCGFCAHHMDSHDYASDKGVVPCVECPDGVCPRDQKDQREDS